MANVPGNLLTILLIHLCLPTLVPGQDVDYRQSAPPDAFEDDTGLAYYGSENPWNRRMFTAGRAREFYKRRGQRELLLILDGKPQQAVEYCRRWAADDPADLESLFNLAVAYCRLQDVDRAFSTVQQAVSAGLPLERFLAGPRDLLRPLTEDQRFQKLAAREASPLIHGPMLGAVTDRSARFWLRSVDEIPVTVQIFAEPAATAPTHVFKAVPDGDADFTAIVTADGLQPQTRYYYAVSIDDANVSGSDRFSFKTYPRRGQPAEFRIGFGGGAGYTPQHEYIWDTIAGKQLDAFFMLGDNVYIDLPEQPGELHRYTYYRRQSRPEFRRLVRSTPIYAVWDDHDVAIDDVWMGPYLDKPRWKQPMLAVFRENWNNPAYGDQQWPGCWFRFAIGDVDFFLLDCRFYRTNPFGKPRSMLGPAQKKWLLDALAESQATFKVIASSVAWAEGAKPGSHDTWDGFPEEREEIFSSIETNHVGGVVLVSADRHRSDAWKIQRPAGYPLYDFMSSRLTNIHTHACLEPALFCYNQTCSFGMLTFDTKKADPTVAYEIVTIDGQSVQSLELKRSELRRR